MQKHVVQVSVLNEYYSVNQWAPYARSEEFGLCSQLVLNKYIMPAALLKINTPVRLPDWYQICVNF